MNATQLMIAAGESPLSVSSLARAANQAKLDGFHHLAQAFETLLRKELKREGKP